MSEFDIRLRRYTPGGGAGAVLPTLEIEWTAPQSDIPALTFSVSEAVTGELPDLLEVAVEAWTGTEWVEPMNGRFFVLKNSVDDLDATGTKSCTGIAMASFILSNALLINPEGVDRKVSGSVGGFLKAAFDEAAARGVGKISGKSFMATTFTAGKDSAGKDWAPAAQLSGITFSHGEKLTGILQILADQAFIEYSFQGRDLHVFNPGTGEDKSVGTGMVTVGSVSPELPVETSLEDLATHIIVRGEEGLSWTFTVPDAEQSLGRLEKTIDASGVETRAQAALIAELYQVTGSRPRKQYTVTEPAAAMTATPVAEYNVGDWVSARRHSGWERMRVTQLQVRRNEENQTEVDIILADRLEDQATRIAKRNAALGARRAGNGQMGRGHAHDYGWGGEPDPKQPGELRIELVDPRGGRVEDLAQVQPRAAKGDIVVGYTANRFIQGAHTAGEDRGYFDIWTGRVEQGTLVTWGFRSRFTLHASKLAELLAASDWFYRLPPAVQEGLEPMPEGGFPTPEQDWTLSRLTVKFAESITVIGDWLIIPFSVSGELDHEHYETFAVGGTRFLKAKIISEYEIGEVSFVQGGDVPTLGNIALEPRIASDGEGFAAITVTYGEERRLYVSSFDTTEGRFNYLQSQAEIDEAERLKEEAEREKEEAEEKAKEEAEKEAEKDPEPEAPEPPPVVLDPDPELEEPEPEPEPEPGEEDEDRPPAPVRPTRSWKWLQTPHNVQPVGVAIGGSLDFRDEGAGLSIYTTAGELHVDSQLNPDPAGKEWEPLKFPNYAFGGGAVTHNHLVELATGFDQSGAGPGHVHVANTDKEPPTWPRISDMVRAPFVHDNYIYGFENGKYVSYRIKEL